MLLLTCCLLLPTACQEGGEAGDLLGQWRMAGSDTKYISFSGTLTLVRSIQEGEVFGKFQHRGDSLFMQYYSVSGSRRDTVIIEEGYGFRPFTDVRVKIEKLDDRQLVISKGDRRWSFDKY